MTSSAQLKNDDTTILSNLTTYLSKANACKSQSSPVVCVEAADRTLGGQIHDYANKLAGGGNFGAKAADVTAARNSAQLLANSMEILGDAQPNQANYNQVLNTFNVNNAISSLQSAVAKVQSRPRLTSGAAVGGTRSAQDAPTVTVKFLVISVPAVTTTFFAGEVD